MSILTVPLGDVAQFIRGITYKPIDLVENFSQDSIVCMRTANVQKILDESDLLSIPQGMVKNDEKILRKGDLLVSIANSWNLVGKCCWVPELNYPATAGGFIAILRGKPSKIDLRYLYHWFSTPDTQADARNCGRQTTNISNMDIGRCLALEIPLPPLPEQRRIAAILDKADALRAKRREAIAKLDQFLQSVFLEMFGDPVTNPREWPTSTVENLCKLVRGSSPRPQGDPRYFGGPIPRLMVADLTRDGWLVTPKIDSLTLEGAKKSRPTEAGTVVMAVSGNVGLASILAVDACIHDGFVSFRDLDEAKLLPISLLMMLHALKATHVRITAGAIFQNLTTTDIKKMELPIPPITLQERHEAIFKRIAEQKDQLLKAESCLAEFFGSLQKTFFRVA